MDIKTEKKLWFTLHSLFSFFIAAIVILIIAVNFFNSSELPFLNFWDEFIRILKNFLSTF